MQSLLHFRLSQTVCIMTNLQPCGYNTPMWQTDRRTDKRTPHRKLNFIIIILLFIFLYPINILWCCFFCAQNDKITTRTRTFIMKIQPKNIVITVCIIVITPFLWTFLSSSNGITLYFLPFCLSVAKISAVYTWVYTAESLYFGETWRIMVNREINNNRKSLQYRTYRRCKRQFHLVDIGQTRFWWLVYCTMKHNRIQRLHKQH